MTWYSENKEKALQWQREYREKNHDAVLENRREYDKVNHSHQLALKKQWKLDNPEKYKAQKKKDDHTYWLTHKFNPKYIKSEKLRHAKYSKANPEKMLKNSIKSLKKLGLALNMKHFKVGMALKNWSQTIRKSNPNCVICNEKADHSHHLFHKAFYPKLALNLNNGVPLCITHHNEIHKWGN